MYRKDMPTSNLGRIKVCCYCIKESTTPFDPPQRVNNMAFDEMCGRPTKKKWSKIDECFNYAPFCPEHQAIVDAQPLDFDGGML